MGYFVPFQSGFRYGQSTMDLVLILDFNIKKAIAIKRHQLQPFLTLTLISIPLELEEGSLTGLKTFLCNRSIQVRFGSELWEELGVDSWIPEGSVIYPGLFNILVNGIFSWVRKEYCLSLFADMYIVLQIWNQGRNRSCFHSNSKSSGSGDRVDKWLEFWKYPFTKQNKLFGSKISVTAYKWMDKTVKHSKF